MTSKLSVLIHALLGYAYKWLVDFKILVVPALNPSKREDGKRIIVSMTSYGRRISSSVVYYSLVSALRQTIQPDKIILWIDQNKWSEDNLSKKLKSLMIKGVEYKFCNDIRSYTKLVPALREFPNDIIITLDDDIIYPRNTIQQLYAEYMQYPNAVCCLNPLRVQVVDGIPGKYETWTEFDSNRQDNVMVFPCGVEGVLYPPHTLSQEVTKEELFKNLCPLADDIWFWFCGCLNNTTRRGIRKTSASYSFDALYQYFHAGSALTHTNRFEHANDKQFRNLFEYYDVMIDNTGKLVKSLRICKNTD